MSWASPRVKRAAVAATSTPAARRATAAAWLLAHGRALAVIPGGNQLLVLLSHDIGQPLAK
jgi:hypothetical protein